MTRLFHRTIPFILTALALVAMAGCTAAPSTSSPSPAPAAPSTATATRGDIAVTIQVNGNLNMPQAFDLKFGAPGNVKDIFVEEGDFVKAGTVLATLDESSLQLDIMSANTALQATIARLYETVPDVQMTMNYPSFYPNGSAALASQWAVDDVASAREYLSKNRTAEAASSLRIASTDLNSCINIFADALANPESGFGSSTLEDVQKYVTEQGGENNKYALALQWQNILDLMKTARQDLDVTAKSISDGKYQGTGLGLLNNEINSINILVRDNVNRVQVRRINTIYPGEQICAGLLKNAEDCFEKALELIKGGGLNSIAYNENLQIADHSMQMCNAMLNNSILVLENGLSLKNYQAVNIDISKAQIALSNSRDNLLKTVIIAPFDGMVVSVGIKRNDILSQVDYSSRSTIQLVDTNSVKFQGMVDEIDILKVQKGQPVSITVDAVPGKVFTGRVSFISPSATKVGNVMKFAITVQLDPTDVELRGTLSATADVAVSSAKNIIKIPLTAISNTTEGAFISVAGAPGAPPEKRQIKVGIQDNQFAEIISGLKEGEVVIIGGKSEGKLPVINRPGQPPPR